MTVSISPRRREKVLRYLEAEGWLTTPKTAYLQDIAKVAGLLDSACEYFPWGRARLVLVYRLLGDSIKTSYGIAARQRRRAERH